MNQEYKDTIVKQACTRLVKVAGGKRRLLETITNAAQKVWQGSAPARAGVNETAGGLGKGISDLLGEGASKMVLKSQNLAGKAPQLDTLIGVNNATMRNVAPIVYPNKLTKWLTEAADFTGRHQVGTGRAVMGTAIAGSGLASHNLVNALTGGGKPPVTPAAPYNAKPRGMSETGALRDRLSPESLKEIQTIISSSRAKANVPTSAQHKLSQEELSRIQDLLLKTF